MKVRVFVPKEYDPADGSNSDGQDFDFSLLPEVGQIIRLTHPEFRDLEVNKVGFIQDGDTFVPCVWVKHDLPMDIDPAVLGEI